MGAPRRVRPGRPGESARFGPRPTRPRRTPRSPTARPGPSRRAPRRSSSRPPRRARSFECKLDTGIGPRARAPRPTAGSQTARTPSRSASTDPAGNVDQTPATRTWTVDTTAPDTTIDRDRPAGTVASTAAAFAFSSARPGATFECKLDAGAWQTCTRRRRYSGLREGAHTFSVRATDAAGNTDATPRRGPGPSTPPRPTRRSRTGPVRHRRVERRLVRVHSSEAGATFECKLDDGALGTRCTSPQGATPASRDGSHTFSVRATDAAGNADAEPGHADLDRRHDRARHHDRAPGPSGTVASTAAFVRLLLGRPERDVRVQARHRAQLGACTARSIQRALGRRPHLLRSCEGRGREHGRHSGVACMDGRHDTAGHFDHGRAVRHRGVEFRLVRVLLAGPARRSNAGSAQGLGIVRSPHAYTALPDGPYTF